MPVNPIATVHWQRAAFNQLKLQLADLVLKNALQDQRLGAIQQHAKQLQEFSESIAPKPPQTYRELIAQSAAEAGRSVDSVARDLGFNSFAEIPPAMNVQGEMPREIG